MIKMSFLILPLYFLTLFQVSGQKPNGYFKLVDSLVLSGNIATSKVLSVKLDSLKAKYMPSSSSFSTLFDRDVDFGYKHKRLNVALNHSLFQIDLLTSKDTIFVRTVRNFSNHFQMEQSTLAFDSSVIIGKVNEYLLQRNQRYHSKKTVNDLLKEISIYSVYAFYCGDGSPITEEGKAIMKLVEDENTEALLEMLQSISIETQAYGVGGFSILERQGFIIPSYIYKIIRHIKARNSETVVCNGCLTGLIEKIYAKK